MEVRVRILFRYLIRGVVLVGRWVVVVTPTSVLRNENFKKVYEVFRAPSVIKGVEESSSVKPYVTFEDVINNSKLPKALSNEALEKQQKIWESIKLQ